MVVFNSSFSLSYSSVRPTGGSSVSPPYAGIWLPTPSPRGIMVTGILCQLYRHVMIDLFLRDCKTGQSGICNGRDSPKIVFAWALNASGIHMPPDVGLKVGPSAAINYLVIQVHYGHAEGVMSFLSLPPPHPLFLDPHSLTYLFPSRNP